MALIATTLRHHEGEGEADGAAKAGPHHERCVLRARAWESESAREREGGGAKVGVG